jgi:hypothetical protein
MTHHDKQERAAIAAREKQGAEPAHRARRKALKSCCFLGMVDGGAPYAGDGLIWLERPMVYGVDPDPF